MKDLFKGYNKKTYTELQELWNKAIFVLDTNLLTSLYKHSEETRNTIFKLIEILKDRIIIPYHAAFEFNKNRYKVITDQEALFDTFIKDLNIVENQIKSFTKHPFLSKELSEEAFTLFDKLKEQVSKEKSFFIELFKNDDIYDKINDLVIDKISDKFSDDTLKEIYEEGEKRYAAKTPPGYRDVKKVENKFGDLIIWKHIIEIAKKDPEKGIIFISDDKKEDWVWSVEGKDIGPRTELVEEIFKETKSDFCLLDILSFIKLGGEFSNTQPSEDAINEIEAFKIEENLQTKKEIFFNIEEYIKSRSNLTTSYDPNNYLSALTGNPGSEIAKNWVNTTAGYDPNNYFTGLTGNPASEIAKNWVNTTAGYTPNNYFTDLTGNPASEMAKNWTNTTAGYTPNNYFTGLTGNLGSEIAKNWVNTAAGYTSNNYLTGLTGNPASEMAKNWVNTTAGYTPNNNFTGLTGNPAFEMAKKSENQLGKNPWSNKDQLKDIYLSRNKHKNNEMQDDNDIEATS